MVETVPAVISDMECEQNDNSKQGDGVETGGGEYRGVRATPLTAGAEMLGFRGTGHPLPGGGVRALEGELP